MKKERVTQDQFKKICERLIDGESLTQICKSDEFPHYRTVLRHINDSEKAHTDIGKQEHFKLRYYAMRLSILLISLYLMTQSLQWQKLNADD